MEELLGYGCCAFLILASLIASLLSDRDEPNLTIISHDGITQEKTSQYEPGFWGYDPFFIKFNFLVLLLGGLLYLFRI